MDMFLINFTVFACIPISGCCSSKTKTECSGTVDYLNTLLQTILNSITFSK